MIGRMRLMAGALFLFGAGLSFADSLSEALAARRFQDAVTIADSLLAAQPRDPRLWTARAVALSALGRNDDSLSSFQHALDADPAFVPALKGAVELGYRIHHPGTAALLDRLLALDPRNTVAHAMAGVLAVEASRCDSAVEHFQNAGPAVTASEQASSLYGSCLITLHRPAEAIPVFERLLAAHPSTRSFRFQLGYAQLLARKPLDAILTLQPLADESSLNLLAAAEIAAHRPDDAAAHLRQAIALAPAVEQNYLDLAALYLQNEAFGAAGQVAEAGLKQLPGSARLHAALGVVKAQFGTIEEAAAEFDRANQLSPHEEYGAAGFGVLYTEANRTPQAIAVLRDRLQKAPRDPVLNYLYADTLLHDAPDPSRPEFDEARQALLRSVAARPDYAKAHALLGKLYNQAEDYASAARHLQLATSADPANRMAWSQLAIALRRLGRTGEANVAVERLRQLALEESQSAPDRKRAPADPR